MSYPQPVFQAAITKALGLSGGAVTPYSDILVNTYSASEVWPLVDISSGTVIAAKVNSARNGTLTGWDLQNAAGPVTGTLAPYSDGANDYGNLLTSGGGVGLVDIFDGDVGIIFLFVKSDENATKYLARFRVDASNLIVLANQTSGQMQFQRYAGGGTVLAAETYTYVGAGWYSVGMSWNTVADEVKTYINGGLKGTYGSIGNFSGTIDTALIGAATTVPQFVLNGYLAYLAVKFGSIWSPTDFLAMHNAAATAGAG